MLRLPAAARAPPVRGDRAGAQRPRDCDRHGVVCGDRRRVPPGRRLHVVCVRPRVRPPENGATRYGAVPQRHPVREAARTLLRETDAHI